MASQDRWDRKEFHGEGETSGLRCSGAEYETTMVMAEKQQQQQQRDCQQRNIPNIVSPAAAATAARSFVSRRSTAAASAAASAFAAAARAVSMEAGGVACDSEGSGTSSRVQRSSILSCPRHALQK